MQNIPWKIILRWIAVLPSAIGGLLVGSGEANIFGQLQRWFLGASSDGGWSKIIYWVVSSFCAGVLAVYWGAKVAPAHRKIVGTIIFSLVLIFAVLGFIFSIYENGWFWPLLSSTAMTFGAGYVMHQIYEEGEDFNIFK